MDRYKINKKDSYLINSPIKQEKKNDKTEVI